MSAIQYLSFSRLNASRSPIVCYAPTMGSGQGLWAGDSPLAFSLPLFLLQVIVVVLTTRIAIYLMKPLGLPRYISEIIGGIVLGPSMFGKIPEFSMTVFPLRSLIILDTIAHIGIVYFIFMVGIEVDEDVQKKDCGRPFSFALVCAVIPFALGSLSGSVLHRHLHEKSDRLSFSIFLGTILCVMAFSVLARNLADLKLVGTEVARIALSAAFFDDTMSWVFLVFSIGLSQNGGNPLYALYSVLSGVAFFFTSRYILRPVIHWIASQVSEDKEVDELYICAMLVGLMIWAFAADAIGIHPVFGAFVYGLFTPPGPLADAIIEKIEDFVNGILMPLFFVISGLRTDIFSIRDWKAVSVLVLVVIAAAVLKVAAGAMMAMVFKMPVHDGVSVGLLLNTKGMTELILLNVGINKLVIGSQTFTVFVFLSVAATAIVSPLLNSVVKPARRFIAYRRRTISWPNPDAELRILVCTHSPRQVPALLTILDIFHPTKRSPLFVYSMHLIELAGRTTTALFLISSSTNPAANTNTPIQGRIKTQSDQITNAFETYEQHAGGVTLQLLTAISPYASMHEDIVSTAQDRQAALILIPFHKTLTVDGDMHVDMFAIRDLNKNILAESPCSVGVLIDRRLAVSRVSHRVTLLFFGGPDDREALALASRMADHPSISLLVLRFIHVLQSVSTTSASPMTAHVTNINDDGERQADEDSLVEFRTRWGRGEVEFVERVVSNAEETVAVIRELEDKQDLFLVGRGRDYESPVTEGLKVWSECPELGPIGDLLASADFGATASVLVLQQGGVGAWKGWSAGPAGTQGAAGEGMPPEVMLYINKADNRMGRL